MYWDEWIRYYSITGLCVWINHEPRCHSQLLLLQFLSFLFLPFSFLSFTFFASSLLFPFPFFFLLFISSLCLFPFNSSFLFFAFPPFLSFPFPFVSSSFFLSSPLLRSGSLPYVTNWKQEPSSGPAQMWPSMAPSQTYTSYMTSKSGSIKLHTAHVYSLQGAQYSGHIDAFRNNMVTSWCTGALHSRRECRRCLNGWVYLREKGITCSSLLSQTCDVVSRHQQTLSIPPNCRLCHFRPDFYTLYLEEPDSSGHRYGPASNEVSHSRN